MKRNDDPVAFFTTDKDEKSPITLRAHDRELTMPAVQRSFRSNLDGEGRCSGGSFPQGKTEVHPTTRRRERRSSPLGSVTKKTRADVSGFARSAQTTLTATNFSRVRSVSLK